MRLTEAEELAVQMLDVINARESVYRTLNNSICEETGVNDVLRATDPQIYEAITNLVDSVFGIPDFADYYLYECVGGIGHGGHIICCDGPAWELRSADDLRAYLLHTKVCPGREALKEDQ